MSNKGAFLRTPSNRAMRHLSGYGLATAQRYELCVFALMQSSRGPTPNRHRSEWLRLLGQRICMQRSRSCQCHGVYFELTAGPIAFRILTAGVFCVGNAFRFSWTPPVNALDLLLAAFGKRA